MESRERHLLKEQWADVQNGRVGRRYTKWACNLDAVTGSCHKRARLDNVSSHDPSVFSLGG